MPGLWMSPGNEYSLMQYFPALELAIFQRKVLNIARNEVTNNNNGPFISINKDTRPVVLEADPSEANWYGSPPAVRQPSAP